MFGLMKIIRFSGMPHSPVIPVKSCICYKFYHFLGLMELSANNFF